MHVHETASHLPLNNPNLRVFKGDDYALNYYAAKDVVTWSRIILVTSTEM